MTKARNKNSKNMVVNSIEIIWKMKSMRKNEKNGKKKRRNTSRQLVLGTKCYSLFGNYEELFSLRKFVFFLDKHAGGIEIVFRQE